MIWFKGDCVSPGNGEGGVMSTAERRREHQKREERRKEGRKKNQGKKGEENRRWGMKVQRTGQIKKSWK